MNTHFSPSSPDVTAVFQKYDITTVFYDNDVYNATTSQTPSGVDDDCVICGYELSTPVKAVRVLLGVCITVANCVMAVAVLRARALHMALKAFLINIALADALMGIAFTYLSIVVDIWPQFSFECRLRYGSLSYLQLVTLYSILVFSVEQVITVARPLQAAQLVTKKTLAVTLTLLWVLPVVMTTVAYELRDGHVTECYFGRFTGTAAFFIFAVSNITAIVLVVVCQVVIFVVAKIQVNKIAPTMVGSDAHHKMTLMNLRVAITTLSVVIPFLLLSTPLLGGYLHFALDPEIRSSKAYFSIITIQFIFTILNAIADPIVYSIRLRSVRLELRKIGRTMTFGKCCHDVVNEVTLSMP
ncbi:somatostatin receptor type 5-like [Littorina saxatilis]|uniref:G-protein coupled receptors family 1 profile domain-containing protein n=1 Tax=Littorina saxatilis TaxID=31220 RepID=A0AAN9GGC5_9CAEN